MWPDRVSNPGPLTYESGALPIALRNEFCKYFLGVNSSVYNAVALGECGRLPTNCIKYWCKLLCLSNHRYPKELL